MDLRFRAIVPVFHGTDKLADDYPLSEGFSLADEYLVLDDVTEGYGMPNIMDVKIGSRTYGPDASEKKMRQEDSKYKVGSMKVQVKNIIIVKRPPGPSWH